MQLGEAMHRQEAVTSPAPPMSQQEVPARSGNKKERKRSIHSLLKSKCTSTPRLVDDQLRFLRKPSLEATLVMLFVRLAGMLLCTRAQIPRIGCWHPGTPCQLPFHALGHPQQRSRRPAERWQRGQCLRYPWQRHSNAVAARGPGGQGPQALDYPGSPCAAAGSPPCHAAIFSDACACRTGT